MPAFATIDPADSFDPANCAPADSSLADEPNRPHSPATISDATPIRNRAQFHWSQQRYLLENIKLADAKAGFVITLASASLSAFFTRGPGLAAPPTISTLLVGLLTGIGITALLAAIAFGAWSIKPRIGSRRVPSPISWTDIAQYPTLVAFQTDARTLTEEDTTEALAEQVFYLSHICHRKHLLIARGIVLAMAGGFCLILDLILYHLPTH